MAHAAYRIESSHPIAGRLWPVAGAQQYVVSDRDLAIALAAKSFTADGEEIRVVHVDTGEIVFRKSPENRPDWSGDA